jgi:hypothetical protein
VYAPAAGASALMVGALQWRLEGQQQAGGAGAGGGVSNSSQAGGCCRVCGGGRGLREALAEAVLGPRAAGCRPDGPSVPYDILAQQPAAGCSPAAELLMACCCYTRLTQAMRLVSGNSCINAISGI